MDDPGSSLPESQRYALLVTASDVSRKRLVRLPWDYALYGLDPDEQEVADAVRASTSIPFFFEPVTLRSMTRRRRPARRFDPGRRQRAVQLPDRVVRPHRRRAAAVADVRRAAHDAPGRPGQHHRGDAAPCRWRCPSSRRCSRPATASTSTTRACRRAASSSTRPASRRSTSASPTSSRSSCCSPGHQSAGAFLADWDCDRLPGAVPGRVAAVTPMRVWLPYADWPQLLDAARRRRRPTCSRASATRRRASRRSSCS